MWGRDFTMSWWWYIHKTSIKTGQHRNCWNLPYEPWHLWRASSFPVRMSLESDCMSSHSISVLLLLSCFSRVQFCATPEMAAHQAPPSLGFSRQEHWSWLPFPSPMHESERWKWSHWVMSNSQRPHGLQPTRLLHPWDFPGKSTGVGCHCLLLTPQFSSCVTLDTFLNPSCHLFSDN